MSRTDPLCVCTHPLSDHNANQLCIALPGVLGCGCFGFLQAPEPVLAYTVGSFWYCPTCFHKGDEPGEATTEDQLMACYAYWCDQCGKLIAKRKAGSK